MSIVILILLIVVVLAAVIALIKAVRIVPQSRAGIVERLGKYQRTLTEGPNLLVPFIDRVLPLARAEEGFRAMAGGEQFGKIVFTV